ncbi:MAG: 50S ribosomal protein L21e [Candidatus Micrarchaeota archaeon]|nr:50S ribosomal protein L21e [Candidatus Micrarchaeota archaeon]
MVKRSRGTLSTHSRKLKSKGRLGVTKVFKQFKPGDKVVVSIKAGHPGMPHPRYRGRHATVVATQGSAYVIEVRDGNATKRLISGPAHLEPA